ncbi:DUF3795 domain-containing protein [candidate division WOR-3 bacterium]|nr:DUF3795 domain-containing protein [candidate division WOR-3 bacterium]
MLKKDKKTKLKDVAYCSLFCGLCSSKNRIPQQAKALRQTMHNEGWDLWGNEFAGFKEFWKFLNGLVKGACSGCRQGGGPPFCGIRKCARERKVEVCVFCSDWPCERIKGLAKGYHTLIPDAERMKRIGLDRWLKEQAQRAKAGFCYCDIRCQPYTIAKD